MERERWVDTAKGIAIIFVVLFHSVIFMDDIHLAGPWVPLSGLMDTFRMPLFFFTAGIFAGKVLKLSFADLFRARIARLFWLYLLWSLLYTIVFQFVPIQRDAPTWIGFLISPVWPNESTWFVYALGLFFIVQWLLRPLPIWLQFVPGVVLALLFGSGIVHSGNGALDKMGTYYVFFVAAVHFGPLARRIAPRTRLWSAILLVVIYVGVAAVLVKTDLDHIPGVRLAASVLAIVTGSALAVEFSRTRVMDWLNALGKRTLPVYFLHFFVILFIVAILDPVAPSLVRFGAIIPPLTTVIAIVAALLFFQLTRRIPGLYALPRPLPIRAQSEPSADSRLTT
jgi:uncharacterized membrane protein YcfT